MAAGQPSDDAAVFDFLDEFLRDLERGKRLPLTHYLARYPGHEDAVAGEYLAELARQQPAPMPRADAQEAAGLAADPQRVGPYRLLRELGRGGQGAVWLAEDTRITRHVALKLLPAEFAALSTERRKRLQREAEVIARLDHPCLCAVLEARMDVERPYIAMRYVQGATLADAIAREREARRTAQSEGGTQGKARVTLRMAPRSVIDQSRLLVFFERAARALHAAHEAGVVHRDVKPQNIMVALNGDPVVLDFGQARDDTSDSFELTRSGDVLGTPAYMSPEQIQGRRAGIDRRTDVWSLGASLYEALTLTRPFEGESVPALFLAIAQAPLCNPRSLNPALSADLALVVATALEKEPARRYASALEFAEDLRRVREYEPVRARPPSAVRVFRSWVRRHPALAFSTLGSIVALSIGLASSLYLLRKANQALEHAVGRHLSHRAQDLIDEDPAVALALGIEAAERAENYQTRAALFEALQACHLRRVIDGHPARRVLDCALSHDGRRMAITLDDGRVLLGALEGGASQELVGNPSAEVRAACFSADDTRLAFVCADGTGQVVSTLPGVAACSFALADAQARAIEFLEGDARLFALSDRAALAVDARDGSPVWRWDLPLETGRELRAESSVHAGAQRALVWTSAGHAWLLDTHSGLLLRELEVQAGVRCAAFSPDGRTLATGSNDGSLRLWRSVDGESQRRFDNGGAVRSVCFAPDGHRLIALLDEGATARAWLWYLETGASVPLQGMADVRIADATFSPDGARIATVGSDMTVRLWNAADARPQGSFKGLFLPIKVAWSADGRNLVTHANDARVQVWFADARPDVFELRGSGARLSAARFSPDGERVLTLGLDGQARLWAAPSRARAALHAETPQPAELLFSLAHRGGVRDGAFSPDGARIATVSDDGQARLWDAQDGRELAVLLSGKSELAALHWDDSGSRIAVRSSDGQAWILDPAAGTSHSLASDSAIRALAWVAGRAQLASAHADNALRLWDADDGARVEERIWPVRKGAPSGALAIASRADGGELALACADGSVHFFEPGKARAAREDFVAFRPQSIAYSSDGKRLFVCGVEGRGALRLQDLETNTYLFQDVFHTGDVTGGSFSADGRWLITTAKAGGAFVRDARDGAPYAHFPGPGGACFAGSISSGSGEARALVVTDNGSVWVWPLDPLAAARARRPRSLTDLELQRERRLALPLKYEPRD